MDPALLREREAFKKRAMAVPIVEKRKAKEPDKSKARPSKKARPAPKQEKDYNYKGVPGSSQFKFAILAKIVKYMKTQHQRGDSFPLSIDEILDETNQLDAGPRIKHWLVTEALVNNPKIEVVDGDKFKFKPKYPIRDRKGLLRLLDKMDAKGQGGILMDDVEEALPNVEKALKSLGDNILYVTRPDRKKVLYYNDKSTVFKVDEEIQRLWRSVAVDGVDERKIEDYLDRQGITSMQDIGAKAAVQKRKKPGGKRRAKNFKTHNEHISNILQDYSKQS